MSLSPNTFDNDKCAFSSTSAMASPAIACGLPCRSNRLSKPGGFWLDHVMLIPPPFSTALIAGWVHRCFVDRRPKTEALLEHQSDGNTNGTPTHLHYSRKSTSSRELGRKQNKRSVQISSFSTRTARNSGSFARAQLHNAASFTGNIRNMCSIDAKSIKLPTK